MRIFLYFLKGELVIENFLKVSRHDVDTMTLLRPVNNFQMLIYPFYLKERTQKVASCGIFFEPLAQSLGELPQKWLSRSLKGRWCFCIRKESFRL